MELIQVRQLIREDNSVRPVEHLSETVDNEEYINTHLLATWQVHSSWASFGH